MTEDTRPDRHAEMMRNLASELGADPNTNPQDFAPKSKTPGLDAVEAVQRRSQVAVQALAQIADLPADEAAMRIVSDGNGTAAFCREVAERLQDHARDIERAGQILCNDLSEFTRRRTALHESTQGFGAYLDELRHLPPISK